MSDGNDTFEQGWGMNDESIQVWDLGVLPNSDWAPFA